MDRERLSLHEVWMVAIVETLTEYTMRAGMYMTSNEDI